MTFQELLQKRRSIRKFRDEPVPLDVIHELIQAAILAPSAGNGQPWNFIIVNDRSMIQRLSAESKKNILGGVQVNPDDYAKKYQKMLEVQDFNVFYDAPCLVIIAGPKDLKNLDVDCALAAAYFMLAATDRGLGTCWVKLGSRIEDPALIEELNLPKDLSIVAPIILGYPDKIPPVPKREKPKILKTITEHSD